MRWPSREDALAAAGRWARALRQRDPSVQRALVIGSAARGDWGVGSDLDLIVVLSDTALSARDRYVRYYPEGLPVPADLWVYTQNEWDALPEQSPLLWACIQREQLNLLAP